MSIHENIRIYHQVNLEVYIEILKAEYGAEAYPAEENSFVIEGLPFYRPQKGEGYIFILGFNMMPLSSLLLQALINHPELAPETTPVQWTAEQEVVVEGEPA